MASAEGRKHVSDLRSGSVRSAKHVISLAAEPRKKRYKRSDKEKARRNARKPARKNTIERYTSKYK